MGIIIWKDDLNLLGTKSCTSAVKKGRVHGIRTFPYSRSPDVHKETAYLYKVTDLALFKQLEIKHH